MLANSLRGMQAHTNSRLRICG